MTGDPESKSSREERLAEKLRENLRRRKAQARAKTGVPQGGDHSPDPLPKGDANS